MIVEQCKILKNTNINHKYNHLILHSKVIASKIKEGQFLNVQCSDNNGLLKRPFSIYRFNRGKEIIEIIYIIKGRGTAQLSRKLPGDEIEVIAPLGNGYDINSNDKSIIIIGRAIGSASLISIAEKAVEMDKKVVAVLSARKRGDAIGGEFLTEIGCKVYYLYDDIGTSSKEVLLDLLKYIIEFQSPDQIFTCGSNKIGKIVQDILKRYSGINGYISLEEKIACGIGTCKVCVCKTKSGYNTICKDGPVFPIDEVIFDE